VEGSADAHDGGTHRLGPLGERRGGWSAMRRAYEKWRPGAEARGVVRAAESICAEYAGQGYDLTLRQLYYQFVARDLLPNTQQAYKRLGDIINRARLAGLLDWDYIVDRTRNLRGTSHWGHPSEVIDAAARSYRIDKWATQRARVEVWVEKEALAGIVQRSADGHDVDWFSCRGYVSQSELWAASQRHLRYLLGGQRVVILHLGDHDPSGIDMTRDIRDRVLQYAYHDWYRHHADAFAGTERVTYADIEKHIDERVDLDGHEPIEIRRIALNRDQVDQYDPPPNPAKLTDSRADSYVDEHGYESWELDALDPAVLGGLIASAIEDVRDPDRYADLAAREARERQTLAEISHRYSEIADNHNGGNHD
jgi:hypothetical protein